MVKVSITGLASSVSASRATAASSTAVVDVELEVLALAHVAHAVDAQPAERADDRLALRVEDLRLEHDVDDHAGHGNSSSVRRPAYPPGQSPKLRPVSRS